MRVPCIARLTMLRSRGWGGEGAEAAGVRKEQGTLVDSREVQAAAGGAICEDVVGACCGVL